MTTLPQVYSPTLDRWALDQSARTTPTYRHADGTTTWLTPEPWMPPYAPTCTLCGADNDADGRMMVCSPCRRSLLTTCACGDVVWQGWDSGMRPDPDTHGWRGERTLMGLVRCQVRYWHAMRGYAADQLGVFDRMREPRVQSIWAHPIWALNLHDEELNIGRYTLDDRVMCEDCVQWCEHCNEAWGDYQSAQDCCSALYRCANCGESWEDDASAVTCCARIHDYCYTPMLRYIINANHYVRDVRDIARGQLIMGIELETERALPHIDAWYEEAHEDYASPSYMWAKRDGSLGDDGVEFVTMPGTIDAHRALFPWDAMANLRERGARAYHMGTCGMHIHCARASFDAPHMWRFVHMQLRNQSMCERVAQRAGSSWAKWHPLRDEVQDGNLPDMIKGKATNGERYVAINFQPAHTIELRYFRANLMPHAMHTRIEFVQALFDYTRPLSVRDVRAGALSEYRFMDWLNGTASTYPYLITYLNNEDA